MRIQFERSGGFAGMRTSASLDTDTLPPEQASELLELIESCGFFNLPTSIQGAGVGADRFQYKLSISSEGREHTVEVGEESAPESLRPLLRRLTTLARSTGGS